MIDLKGLSEKDALELLPPNVFYLAYTGSIAHGMYQPSAHMADKDIRGACVAGLDVYLGNRHFEQKEASRDGWDSVVYEARKFVRLLVSQNPSVLECLWVDPKHRIVVRRAGQLLLENRGLFVARRAYHHFTGYAYSQLRKMEAKESTGHLGAKRKALVEKHGLDTKQGSHLIRILRMSIEYLREGVLHVDRGQMGDATMLLEIKNGEWPLEKVKAEAERLFVRAEAAYDESKLPNDIDKERVNELCVEVVRTGLADSGWAVA